LLVRFLHSFPTRRSSDLHPALVFTLIVVFIFLLHLPLLQLPYFWDEAGYYVPAARDLLLTGSLIPHSTVSNAHPPLVMAYLAVRSEEHTSELQSPDHLVC